MELEGQIESQQTRGWRNCFQKNFKTLLARIYKCHGVGQNRFRAGKLFRDFLQSPCFIEGKSEPREAKVTYKRSPNSHYCQGKNSGVCSEIGWASQWESGQTSETITPTPPPPSGHFLSGPGTTLNAIDALGHWIPTTLNDRCYLSPGPASGLRIIFEEGTLHFHFTLNPRNYAAGLQHLRVTDD